MSTLRNGTTRLSSQRYRAAGFPLDLAVHRVLEQDRTEDPIATEVRAGDDARAHLVDNAEHLLVTRVAVLIDSVQAQRLGRAATTLIEGGDETGFVLDLLQLLGDGHDAAPDPDSLGRLSAGIVSERKFSVKKRRSRFLPRRRAEYALASRRPKNRVIQQPANK